MRKENPAIEFLQTYLWAILSAIIVIGVLAYFGVFSPCKYGNDDCGINKKCLAENFCENQTLGFNSYYGKDIYCEKYISQDIYWKIDFEVDNWTGLNEKFPECKNATK
jgi:hypothetical protein